MSEHRPISRVSKVRKINGEWVVKAWVGADGATRYPEGDYYTNDKQDALDTAAKMVIQPAAVDPRVFKND